MSAAQIAGALMLGAFITAVAVAAYRSGGWKHAAIAAGSLVLLLGLVLLFP